MTQIISAELFKMRTTRTFYALVASAVALVLLPSIPILAFVDFAPDDDPLAILMFFLSGLVQVFALLLGILAATNEFRHGTITPSLLVVPNRVRLMLSKLVAALLVGFALGLVTTGLIVVLVAIFGSYRDFNVETSSLAVLIGGSLASALFAGLGVGLGALVRNQVGAVVGALVYIFILEPALGGVLSLVDALDDIMPKYSLGAVGNGLMGADFEESEALSQLPSGLILTAYVAIFIAVGLAMVRRRDITA
ncbi:MAG TPA: ABC transporter permease [Actinomycetota bacterium]|nr:ABC transporter permease [Actinomycetota bacterium]